MEIGVPDQLRVETRTLAGLKRPKSGNGVGVYEFNDDSMFEFRVKMFGADHNPFFISTFALLSAFVVLVIVGLSNIVSTAAIMGLIVIAITSLFRAKEELDVRHAALLESCRVHQTVARAQVRKPVGRVARFQAPETTARRTAS